MPASYDNNMDVNPESMNELASEIKQTGEQYQGKVKAIFDDLRDMNQFWEGQEYEACVTKFNESKPTLDDLGELVTNKIPSDITSASDNYADTQNRIRNMFS